MLQSRPMPNLAPRRPARRPAAGGRAEAAATRARAASRPPRPEPRAWALLLVVAVPPHLALLAPALGRPFGGANEDDNAVFGLGALNLARFGFLPLRFGLANAWYDSAREIGANFYTHHPQALILPSALLFRVFGASDW